MAYRVIRKSGGSCCTCAQQRTACDCGPESCALECRSKEGIATLCGFDEMGTPSVPPRVFKKRDVTGELQRCLNNCDTRLGSSSNYSVVKSFENGTVGCSASTPLPTLHDDMCPAGQYVIGFTPAGAIICN